MSDQTGSTTNAQKDAANNSSADKGKGKATEATNQDISMDEDSSSEEEADEVRLRNTQPSIAPLLIHRVTDR